MEQDIIKSLEEDEIMKSWSTDLMKKNPGGQWVTVNGAKVFLGGSGKVIAGPKEVKEKLNEGKKGGEKEISTTEIKQKLQDLSKQGTSDKVLKEQKHYESLLKQKESKKSEKKGGELSPSEQKDFEKFMEKEGISYVTALKAPAKMNFYIDKFKKEKGVIKDDKPAKPDKAKPDKAKAGRESKKHTEARKLSKKNLDYESTEGLNELQKNAAKLDGKYLKAETKEKIRGLIHTIHYGDHYEDGLYFGDTKGYDDKLTNIDTTKISSLAETLKVAAQLNTQLKKEETYTMEEDMFEKTQKLISDALKEQSNKKTTEALQYKMFKSMEPDIIKALGGIEEDNFNDYQETIMKGFDIGVYDEDMLEKAIGHKYFKRESKAGGGYKYYYTEAQYKKEKKDGGSKESYESLSAKTPSIGKTVIVNAGRFKNAEGKILSRAGDDINAWMVKMSDGSKAIIFPTDLKVKENSDKKDGGKKPFNIPSAKESIANDYNSGKITLKQAAEEFHENGNTNFVDIDYARKTLAKYPKKENSRE